VSELCVDDRFIRQTLDPLSSNRLYICLGLDPLGGSFYLFIMFCPPGLLTGSGFMSPPGFM